MKKTLLSVMIAILFTMLLSGTAWGQLLLEDHLH